MRITQVSKNLPQNNSETVTNENSKEVPKERYNSIYKIYNGSIIIV